MSLPGPQEAVAITLATNVSELRPGDVVGPSDVSQPADYTVIGAPRRTYRQQVEMADVLLRVEDSQGTRLEEFPATATVYVRRWRALATITRADGSVDAIRRTVRLRALGDAATIVNALVLRLQPGDSYTLSAV